MKPMSAIIAVSSWVTPPPPENKVFSGVELFVFPSTMQLKTARLFLLEMVKKNRDNFGRGYYAYLQVDSHVTEIDCFTLADKV